MLRTTGLSICLLLVLVGPAFAGGGPETSLVVVNAESAVSRLVANEYVKLRDIPANRVCEIDGVPSLGVVTLKYFRDEIWRPIQEHITKQGLEGQVDLIAYSADFPYAVDFSAALAGKQKDQGTGRHASLTGVTYLINQVLAGEKFWDWFANRYFRYSFPDLRKGRIVLYNAHGFRSTYGWRNLREPVVDAPEDDSHRYYLSTQLAYTGRFGNSVPEILAYLRSGAASDGTKPDGTVYICRNGNVRSKAREPFFAPLSTVLGKMGRKVEILENSKIPKGKEDVIGAVVGTAGFAWGSSKARMLPGAIAEHLTSFGAHFGTAGQTKISEFLRHGAAGSSGTVQEPLSIHLKFPNPMVHAWYGEGASLAEAFYQSVGGPYQLMVAGDGLARPFATFAKISVEAPPSPWKGVVAIEAAAKDCNLELWVNGRRHATGEMLELDTTTLDDGHHDVRVVAIARDAVATRSYEPIDAAILNGKAAISVSRVKDGDVVHGETFRLRAKGAKSIRVLNGVRVVAETSGAVVTVPTLALGPGPARVIPLVTRSDGTVWRAEAIEVNVVAPSPLSSKGTEDPVKPGLRGHAVVRGDEQPVLVPNLGGRLSGLRLREQIPPKGVTDLVLSGEIEAPADGFYQLAVLGGGRLTMSVAGREICRDLAVDTQQFLPVSLAKGWHPVEIAFEPRGVPRLEILMGGDRVLAAPRARHASLARFPREPKVEGATKGKPIAVPAEGLVLSWSRSVSKLGGVTLFPAAKSKTFPTSWTVEVSSGRNRWKAVKNAVVHVPAAAKKRPVAFVEITFKSTRAKKLRVRPGTPGAVTLSRVDVLRAK